MLLPKETRIRDAKHRKWIASLPCCVTGVSGFSQAAHIRHGLAGGMGLKPCDSLCVPLHFMAHATQHRVSEVEYWGDRLEAAKQLAKDLYAVSGDTMAALLLIAKFRSL